jgi:succinate dehydrogenase/fumarate reductase flavoprotein subunit
MSNEVAEGRGPIYLEIPHASQAEQDLCRKLLPQSFKVWDRAGVSPFAAPVPWMPVLQGTTSAGGGIKIDLNCSTNVNGLYAAGDICWIGPHGTYSLGGINIGFTSVSGYWAGQQAAQFRKFIGNEQAEVPKTDISQRLGHRSAPLTCTKGESPEEAILLLQKFLFPYDIAYIKDRTKLTQALSGIEALEADIVPRLSAASLHDLVKAIEIENMAKIAKLMLQASLAREESRGFHFRKEFPYTDNENWLKLIMLQKESDGRVGITTQAVATPFVKPKAARSLPPGVKPAHAAEGLQV